MAKQKMKAMVKYNNDNDSFELWIGNSNSDNWGFVCSAKCYAVGDEAEANFIHYSFLTEVLKCAMLGYEIVDGRR